jgi:adenine/guanine phosphoribosyltransferase-like PRPP-binding protein
MAEVAPQDYDKLVPFGVSKVEGHSWQESDRKEAGLRLLLEETGFGAGNIITYSEFPLSIEEQCGSLGDYFSNFTIILNHHLQSALTASDEAEYVLVLNLMPLYLSTSRIDKIVEGLYKDDTLINRFQVVVLLLRNIDWMLKSIVFQKIHLRKKFPAKTIAIDIRCFGASFLPDKKITNFEISRAPIRAMLNTEYDTVYKSLIYETNSFIGHFALRASHIRTHYDLTEYIKRDNVWEYLHEKFTVLVAEKERILIIGVGMENAVIHRIGEQIKTLLGDKVLVDFYPVFELSTIKDAIVDWDKQYDIAIVVTDIINTGETIKMGIDALKNQGQGGTIGAFAVARMQNSPDTISGVSISTGVVIRRDFYSIDPTRCPLCKISQPLISVKKAEDFCQVTDEQLTPFDFWELASEAKALKREMPDPQGRLLSYRIDTIRLFRHYNQWLVNVIKHKFIRTWPNMKPDVIFTVREPTGIGFAGLVGKSLGVKKIVDIDRSYLHRVTPGGGLPSEAKSPFVGRENVLIVDDGINYGYTMSQLINFCRAAGAVTMGGMVFDNRLDEREINKIRFKMGRAKLVSLYDWPATARNL